MFGGNSNKFWLLFGVQGWILITTISCQPNQCIDQSWLDPDTLSAYEARAVDSARYAFYGNNGHLKFNYKGHDHSILEFDAPVGRLGYKGDTLVVSFDIKLDSLIDIYQLEQYQNKRFKNDYSATFAFYTRNDSLILGYSFMSFSNIRTSYEPYYNNKSGYVHFDNFFDNDLKKHLTEYSGELDCWLKERAIARGWSIGKSK